VFAAAFQDKKITSYAYRPFDRRLIYLDERYVNRHGPKLRAVLGEANVALYAMPYKTGAGPAAVVHASWPDYHAFRGSYGGYAFPLYDRRPASNGFNLDLRLVRALSERYQTAVTPEQVF
jgi:predicted helicase